MNEDPPFWNPHSGFIGGRKCGLVLWIVVQLLLLLTGCQSWIK